MSLVCYLRCSGFKTLLTCKLFLFTAIVESDDLRAVINEMDKAFNYSQKVSFSLVVFDAA